MSTIVTRAGNGAPLTNTQVDDNFTNLNTDKLEINAALGTPVSVTLTNATGLPTAGLVDNAVTDAKLRDSAGLSVIGRGANSTGDPADIVAGTNHQVLRRDGSSLAFGAVDLSSNQAVTGTLPVNQGGTGITSFGSGVATWLATPSSANLAAAVTDETGSGALVFGTNPVIDGVTVPARTNPLSQAVRVAMTAAASGSNGIQVLDNDNLDMGTNNFTLHWEGSLPDWTPSTITPIVRKNEIISNAGWILFVNTNGTLRLAIRPGDVTEVLYNSTVSTGITDGQYAKITVSIVRETLSSAGSVTFYVNGSQIGASVAIASGTNFSLSGSDNLYINGRSSERVACDYTNAIIYNRALSAAEVLSLCVNGAARADIGASQVAVYTSDFSAGVDGFTSPNTALAGNIDTDADGAGLPPSDNWLRSRRSGSSGRIDVLKIAGPTERLVDITVDVVIPPASVITHVALRRGPGAIIHAFIPVSPGLNSIKFSKVPSGNTNFELFPSTNGTTVSTTIPDGDGFYIKNFVITQIGITGQWNAQDAQSNTGQIFDSSGNKNHALLPAAGATIIGKEMSVPKQVRWTNTWAGTNELQYIGGVNQAILPAKAYIESIVGVITGATVEDIIIGDGSDTDRYVTITTGLAAGTTSFTLANRTTDGTNLKLTVDPDTNCTMSIAWVISYRILE